MSLSLVFFLIVTVFIGSTALYAVTTNNILRASVALFFCFVGISVYYLYFDMQYLAFVQLFIFVGGIAILNIFALMTLGQTTLRQANAKNASPTIATFLAMFVSIFSLGITIVFTMILPPSNQGQSISVASIGQELLSPYVLPFELLSLIILVSIIGSMSIIEITHGEKTDRS